MALTQAAAVAGAPALRVTTGIGEPPPWMDVPFDDEAVPASVGGVVVAASSVAVPAPPPDPGLGERWADIVRQLNDAGLVSAFTRELAMQSQCLSFADQAQTVVCRLCVERETLRASTPCDKLQAALAELLGRSVRLEVEAGAAQDSPARRDAAQRARRQLEAEQIIHDDPLVRALMAQYKTARIVPGSVKPH